MSDSMLPNAFEGFPQLANKVEALNAAFDRLSDRLDAKKAKPTKAEPALVLDESAQAATQTHELEEQVAMLQGEVKDWQIRYDALAARFEEELAAVQVPRANEDQEALLRDLRAAKESADAQVAQLQRDLAALQSGFEAEKQDLQADIEALKTERDDAQKAADASAAINKQASERLGTLIESLNAAQ